MKISDIINFFEFCKWAQLQYATGLISSEKFDTFLFAPDIFARKLKDDGYTDEFIKTMIKYIHKYKLDRIKNKLPKITYYDYSDEKDKEIISTVYNRFQFKRFDYGIPYIYLS